MEDDFINYYKEIKNTLIKNESYKRIKDYSKNRSDLNAYYEVGKLIVEAQGGEARAKYGDRLIRDYSIKLTNELGHGYSIRSLKYMRKFYIFQKGQTVSAQLTWSHYVELIKLDDVNMVRYYTGICEIYNLSVRELRNKIKSKEYERIGYKCEIEKPKVNTLIKNPIFINSKCNLNDEVTEYTLHKLILEDMDNFLKELGYGFSYIGHEVKIKIGSSYHYIDFLLFNIKFNCYIVVEIKVNMMKAEYIGQIQKYMNYVDKNIKEIFNEKCVGIIICQRNNQYVLEYCSDDRIFTTTYKII